MLPPMSASSQAIRERLKRFGNVDIDPVSQEKLSLSRCASLDAEENNPARVAPSAEGVTTFAGLPKHVRSWLSRELADVGRKVSPGGTPRRRSR